MISYHRIYEKNGFSIDVRTGGDRPKWILKKIDGSNVQRVATFDFLEAAHAALEQELAAVPAQLKQLLKH